MVLEPRKVESGFVRRWTGEAIELMTRSFHLWFGMAVLCCLLSAALHPLPLVTMLPLGLIIYFMSVEFAAASDEKEIQFSDIPAILRSAINGMVQDIWAKRWLLLILAAIMAYSLYTDEGISKQAAKAATSPSPAESLGMLSWIIGPSSPFVQATLLMLFGTLLQGRTVAFATLEYPLTRGFKLDGYQSMVLLHKAFRKNMLPAIFLQTIQCISVMIIGVAVPILMPFIICFLPALTYVAFREVFVDGNGNREPAKAKERKAVAQGAL